MSSENESLNNLLETSDTFNDDNISVNEFVDSVDPIIETSDSDNDSLASTVPWNDPIVNIERDENDDSDAESLASTISWDSSEEEICVICQEVQRELIVMGIPCCHKESLQIERGKNNIFRIWET